MTVNNLCKWLIVYGSYAPGGKNHGVFSGLPGEWKKGKILCNLIDPPDGIGPDGYDEVEAWAIAFSDCQAEMFTPEYEIQKRLLYERWTALDRALGDDWARDQKRWWPEDRVPVVGDDEMIVVNIYLPLKYAPYLKDRLDEPSPDEEDDLQGMWNQVKARTKRYDWSAFIALIKDATPDQYAELFGDLPGGDEFIRKLERFYQEHRKGDGNLLADGASEFLSLYVCPLEKHALADDELMDLVKAEVASRAALLRTAGLPGEAAAVEALSFAFGKPQPTESIDDTAADDLLLRAAEDWAGPAWVDDTPTAAPVPAKHTAAEALVHAQDIIADSRVVDDHWFNCLKEACYGIAASYDLTHWLMSHWLAVDLDFERTYRIWKAGGTYEIAGDTCYVYRILEVLP